MTLFGIIVNYERLFIADEVRIVIFVMVKTLWVLRIWKVCDECVVMTLEDFFDIVVEKIVIQFVYINLHILFQVYRLSCLLNIVSK